MRDCLRRIQASHTFENCERLLEFLEHIVNAKLEGREEDLKESCIGVDLFHRAADYDPKIDSIVRTQARRLRDRLAEYYRTEGVSDPAVLTVPKGGYSPTVEIRIIEAGAAADPADLSRPSEPDARETPNPRQTAVGPWQPRWAFWGAIGGVAAILLAWGIWRLGQPAGLSHRDTIVLSDFANHTGDEVFDEALSQGLTLRLQQSPHLQILSPRRIQDTLQRMGRLPDEKLTKPLAMEVCQRTGSAAVVAGSVARLGDHYLINLQALGCHSGESLGHAEHQVPKKEEVLGALNRAAATIREQLGESSASIVRHEAPLAEATTPSLEALKFYSLGYKVYSSQGAALAIPLFSRAIELDPNFALAHHFLGNSYRTVLQDTLADQSTERAFALRARVSERERFLISSNYYKGKTGELEKAISEYRQWALAYPRDFGPKNNLALSYMDLGKYDMAVPLLLEGLALEPTRAAPYINLMVAYGALNLNDKAKALFRDAQSRGIDHASLHVNLYGIAFATNDWAEMKRQASWCEGKQQEQETMLSIQAATRAYMGQIADARALSLKAIESEARKGHFDSAARRWAFVALVEAELGNNPEALRAVASAQQLSASAGNQLLAALTLARIGQYGEARKLAEEVNRRNPLKTSVQRYWLPTIRAAVALADNSPGAAIEALQSTEPIELGAFEPQIELGATMYPAYVRGLAYLALRDGKAAETEFRKFEKHRGVVVNFPLGALARLGIARALAMQADKSRTRAAYMDFLSLWKDADPEIPILKQAISEFAKLQ